MLVVRLCRSVVGSLVMWAVAADVMVGIARLVGPGVTSSVRIVVAWHALRHVLVYVRLFKVWLRRRVCHRFRLARFSQISSMRSLLLLRNVGSLGLGRRVDRFISGFILGLMPGLQLEKVGLFVGIAVLEGLLVGSGSFVYLLQGAFHHHRAGVLGRVWSVQADPELEDLVFFLWLAYASLRQARSDSYLCSAISFA